MNLNHYFHYFFIDIIQATKEKLLSKNRNYIEININNKKICYETSQILHNKNINLSIIIDYTLRFIKINCFLLNDRLSGAFVSKF